MRRTVPASLHQFARSPLASTAINPNIPAYFPHPNNVVGYWKMDGTLGQISNGATIPAIVGSAGIANSAASYSLTYDNPSTSPFGSTLNSDGTGYIILPDLQSGQLTVNIWIGLFPYLLGNPAGIISSTGGDWYVSINSANNIVFGNVFGNFTVISNSSILDIGFHMITCTFDTFNGGIASIYLDGLLDSAVTTSASMPFTGANYQLGLDAFGSPFQGDLNQLSVWQTDVLDATDIADLFNGGAGQSNMLAWVPPDTPGAVLNYNLPMTGASAPIYPGSSIPETTGAGDGVAFGSAPLIYVAGEIDQAIEFDGHVGFVQVPDSAPLRLTSNFTITAWINGRSNDFYQNLFWKANYPTDGWGMILAPSGPVMTCEWQVSPAGSNPSFTINIAGNGWTYISVTWDGTNLKMYQGAILKGTFNAGTTPPALPIISGTHPFIIGADNDNSRYFQGSIDEVSIWNVALTQAELNTILINQ